MWCLYMIGLHPEVQEKAYNEVQFISVKNGKMTDEISYEDCSSFKYLESVILVKFNKISAFIKKKKILHVHFKCIFHN